MYRDMDSADAVSRRVLYYYYVARSVGKAANRMGTLVQGCASCRFPGNHAVHLGAVRAVFAQQTQASFRPHLSSREVVRAGAYAMSRPRMCFCALRWNSGPHRLRTHDGTDTRLFSCPA